VGTSDRGDVEGEAMSVDRPQGLIEGSGRRGESRRLDQMISARLDPTLVAALRQLAAKRGISLSDVLREAALMLLAREEASNLITFEFRITNERTGGITHESFRQDIEIAV
jgi:antitoxin component of RelBE/YafQ-DinJ toxin-antitoxin module